MGRETLRSSEPTMNRIRSILFVLSMLIAFAAASIARADGRTRTWTIDGVEREAIVHLPAKSTADSPIKSPLILAFHGHGGRAANVQRSMHFQDEWPEAIVVYPQGLATKSQRDPEGTKAGWQNRVGEFGDRDIKFVDAIAESLRNEGWVDDARVFATGHSNGGGFTYALWNARPGMLTAVAPVAAGSFDVLKLTPLACMHVAARADKIVLFARQERTMAAVRRINGCPDDEGKPWAKDCMRWDSSKRAPFVAMIVDGGHEYPREAPPLIVRFFKEQSLRDGGPRNDASGNEGPRNEGPWNNDIGVFKVDANTGEVERMHTFARAGVSSVVRLETGDLLAAFQWFPEGSDNKHSFDRIALSRSTDGGKTWSAPKTAEIKGLSDDERAPFDPTLVALDEGRVRLYMTRNAKHGSGTSFPSIGSAVSSDGERFKIDDGVRFAVEGEQVIDCAVTRFGPTWHLICPIQCGGGGKAYHAISADGLKFARVADLSRDPNERWLGALTAVNGAMRFYGVSDRGIWCEQSLDGVVWSPIAGIRATPIKVPGADPGVAFLPNGDAIVTATVMKPMTMQRTR